MNDVANDVDDSLGELLALQRTAFLREGPPSLAQRRADLKKLRTAIVARKTDITDAMMADFGHRAPFASLMEPLSVVLRSEEVRVGIGLVIAWRFRLARFT